MPAWIQLSRETTHSFYRVPLELTETDLNAFYGAEHHRRDTDGPWPLLAFLQERKRPDVLTFQLYTIEAEELAMEAFNPLNQPRGYLSLDRESLTKLLDLLSSYATKLSPGRHGDRQVFRRIEDSKLTDFGLHPEWFPDSQDRYYQQLYDPVDESTVKSAQTILIFSTGQPSQSSARLYFKVAQFAQQRLFQPTSGILDDSFARINLDRRGLVELVHLLEAQLQKL